MRILRVNIEDIHIRGNISQLSEVVTSIDDVIQRISQETESIMSVILRYSSSNSGKQYEKMAETMMALGNFLYDSSLQINMLQNEIVEYQNKVMRYEEVSFIGAAPKKLLIQRANLDLKSKDIKFELNQMNSLVAGLSKYSASVYYQMQELIKLKNDASHFWVDSQYREFAEFIDEISMKTMDSLKSFGEYVDYLKQKIKELS